MKKTLFMVCEFGSGLGHIMRLRRNAAALKRRGWTVVAGLTGFSFADRLRDVVDDIVAVPAWPAQHGESWFLDAEAKREQTFSYASTLRAIGAASPRVVGNILPVWERLLSRVNPSVLMCDNGPGALIAANDRLPTIVIGTGFTVPAAADGYFCPSDGSTEPDTDFQDKVFANISEGLAKFGRTTADLTSVFRGVYTCPATLTALDPSAGLRREPVLPPELELPKDFGDRSEASKIYVYLGEGSHHYYPLYDWLPELRCDVRCFGDAMKQQTRADLASKGVAVSPEPFTLAELRKSARLLIHHGGMGITQLGAIAGVPQVIFYSEFERWRNAVNVHRLQAGVGVVVQGISKQTFIETIEYALATPTLEREAERWRQASLLEFRDRPTTEIIADYADESVS